MKRFLSTILYFLFSILLTAQTITFNEDSTAAGIENKRVYFPFNNEGKLAQVNVDTSGSRMRYDDKVVMFAGGFTLSGFSDSTLFSNGILPNGLIQDYIAGNIESNPDDPGNKIYAVKATDIPFGEEWQNWKTAVEQGAYFYDGDNDGIYNPVDKNENGQWDTNEDKPDILYDASLFTVYNDAVPASERRWNTVEPLGIEISQTVFVSNRNTILDDVVFIRYSVLYKGLDNPSEPDSLTDVIFSVFADNDIGGQSMSSGNDLAGCDTLLQSGFIYNDSADVDWGIDPPAVFKTIIQGPLVKSEDPNSLGYNRMGPDLGHQIFQGYSNTGMSAYMDIISGEPLADLPHNKTEIRNNMLGLIRDGSEPDPCNWILGEVRGDINCTEVNPIFWHSGDPVSNTGWIASFHGDTGDLTSTGKFTLRKNEPMDIIVAYTVGRGTDHLNSITVARETVQYIHEEYERNFSTIVGVEEEEKEELPSSFTLYQNYPNPFNPTTKIKFAIPPNKTNTKLIVYDILGREIKTLINHQLNPGEYEIEFDASDLSSGVYFYTLNFGDNVITKKMTLIR